MKKQKDLEKYQRKLADKQKAYDFSARMYMPSYASFTTMDPLCEQDPGRSPYLYCAGNPINLVDPDGRDWTRQWRLNTVTVCMTIYATDKKSYDSALLATGYWKNRTGDTYLKNGKKYKIRYDISVINSNPPRIQSNTYTVTDNRKFKKDNEGQWTETLGQTNRTKNTIWVQEEYSISKRDSDELSLTGAHEIGHLLGIIGHTDGTLMSESPDDKRTSDINQSQINQIIESAEGKDDFLSRLFSKLSTLK